MRAPQKKRKWKAIEQPYRSPLRLYDLSQDIGEDHNLATLHPELVTTFTERMKQCNTPSETWKFPASRGR